MSNARTVTDDRCDRCGAGLGLDIELAGPAALWWRDGHGTVFICEPDEGHTESSVAGMSTFRRQILRAWLTGMVSMIDRLDPSAVGGKPEGRP